jgi:hypothetical protein
VFFQTLFLSSTIWWKKQLMTSIAEPLWEASTCPVLPFSQIVGQIYKYPNVVTKSTVYLHHSAAFTLRGGDIEMALHP